MNRILFEAEEIAPDARVVFGGVRSAHVMEVLHGEVGQTLKTGVVGGPVGTSRIEAIERVAGAPEGEAWRITARTHHDVPSLEPWVDLVLAPPRPRVMKRLLPQLATMGVGRIVLVGAKKVEKDFWGATLLKPENLRPLLVEGLMQAGTSILPEVLLRRNFRRFVTDELDQLLPSANRVVAHPYADSEAPGAGRLTLAIGPEGGWTDEEVALLREHGFRGYSLGPRILRTDTAAIALLARLAPGGSL